MPTILHHQNLIERNRKTLGYLSTVSLMDSAVNDWIITVSYYIALHLVEIAANGNDKETNRLLPHADRLEFLEAKCVKAKQFFHNLYVLSESTRYGISFDDAVLVHVKEILTRNDFSQMVSRWLEHIESIVTS